MIVVDESEPVGEIEPPFESRDVLIRRGLNVRDFFDMEEEIGRGKFGTVFKCREKKTGLRLAAKFVQAAKKADRINVEREVEIMKSLRNPRLIQLYDAFDDGKKEICLLLELIEGGELFERVIDDDFVLTERACAIFMRQICEGIQFIHLQHVLHLDMKPENILCLTREGNRIKLIDFGLARRYDPSKKLQVLFGTPEFVAPEVVNFDQIGYGTDMWSVGIIGYVLLSGLSPFMGETDVETMANVTIAKYDFDDEAFNDVSNEAKDFISKLLVKQISKRMTATESLRHPWLRPRPPLPAPTLPAPRQEEQESSSPTPSSTPIPMSSPPQETITNVLSVVPEAALAEPVEQAKPIEPATLSVPSEASGNDQSVPSQDKKDSFVAAASTAECKEVLQVAKVNLRQFVERWNSNPNSPFQLNSESPQTIMSLLMSTSPSQMENSPTSLTGMSPSPQSYSPTSTSLATSPVVKESIPIASMESEECLQVVNSESRTGNQTNDVCVSESASSVSSNTRTTSQSTTLVSTTRVEAAIEQTSALLKSVKESLIRQIETGTAVRDRTGARVWERKGSGLIGSPGPAGQRRAPLVHSASLGSNSNSQQRTPNVEESQDSKFSTPQSEPKKTDDVVESIEDWEIHPPVEARAFGFAKRHKTINSTVKVVKATESITTGSYSLSSSSTVIEMDSHQP